jgi:DNA-binding transcriptional LysR family regulator
VSNALRRLRDQVGDELFIKVPTGVRPTARAEAIWPVIRQSLAQIHETLSPGSLSPASFRGTITIALTDYTALLLLPRLAGVLEAEAPGLDLRTVPNLHLHSSTAVEDGEIDLALGVFATVKTGLCLLPVLEERYVCIMRRGHPLSTGRLTPKRLVEATHLMVTPSGETIGNIDQELSALGLTRRVGLTVNQFMIAPRIVARSSLVAILLERALTLSEVAEELHIVPLPLSLPTFRIQMLWHRRTAHDPAQAWLRARIAALLADAQSIK